MFGVARVSHNNSSITGHKRDRAYLVHRAGGLDHVQTDVSETRTSVIQEISFTSIDLGAAHGEFFRDLHLIDINWQERTLHKRASNHRDDLTRQAAIQWYKVPAATVPLMRNDTPNPITGLVLGPELD